MERNEKGTLLKVSQIKPFQKGINTKVKIVKVENPIEVFSRGKKHRVCEALVGDETGCLVMTLWDDEIDRASEGTVIKIENAYTDMYRGSLRLSTGKYGSFEVIEDNIPSVNIQNNLSRGFRQHHYRIPDSIANSPPVKPSKQRRKRR